MKKGAVVEIYESPTVLEGWAKLVKFLARGAYTETWEVQFLGAKDTCERRIKT